MKKIVMRWAFLLSTLLFITFFTQYAYAVETDFKISEDGTLEKYIGSDTIVIVPDNVKVIGKSAFYNCKTIKEIIIPEGVTKIGDYAFGECSDLEHISLPSTLTTLGGELFSNCLKLKSVAIPKSVTEWDISSLSDCCYDDKIERFEVDPENAAFCSLDGVVYNKAMTEMLFYPNDKEEDTYIVPDSVTELRHWEFGGDRKLKQIILNNKVTLRSGAYDVISRGVVTSGLERFTVPAGNETFCDIDGVLYLKDRKTLIAYPENKKGLVYKIPEGTKRIWTGAFVSYSNLELRYIIFPHTIKKIDDFVGYHLFEDEAPPNRELVFFGEKDSLVEYYATLNQIQFSPYNPKSIKATYLFIPAKLSFDVETDWYIEPLWMPSGISKTVSWKSSNPSVVAINQDGMISSKKVGTAIISATAKNGVKAYCQIAVKLSAPTEFRAVKVTPSSIKLAWNRVPGAKSYTIYRCIGYKGLYKKLGTTTKLSFTDKKVKEGLDYNYAVRANHSNSQYDSNYSEILYLP